MVSAARSDGVEAVAGQGVDLACRCRGILGALAVRPDLRLGLEQRPGGGELRREFGGDHDMLRRDDIDAMGERRADQVGVDQRDHAADAGDADPDRHVFRPVRHQQAHRLALAEILAARPAGVAVGALGERAIAESLAVGDQRRRIAEPVGEFLDHDGKHPRRILGDRRRHPQRAIRAAQEDDVVLMFSKKLMLAPCAGEAGTGMQHARDRFRTAPCHQVQAVRSVLASKS